MFLIFPGVSSKVVKMWVCREIDGEVRAPRSFLFNSNTASQSQLTWRCGLQTYLLADFSLHCYDAQWRSLMPISIVMLAIYPIGIPLTLLVILLYKRGELRQPSVLAAVGFLYEAFSKNAWFFELVCP